MCGIAQQLFNERTGRETHPETLLEDLVSRRYFLHVDYAFAQNLSSSVDAYPFLCYLMAAARNGHLCISVDDKSITPDPGTIFINDLTDDELDALRVMIREGVSSIPASIITDTATAVAIYPPTPICQFGNMFYLQRYWAYESVFLQNLDRLIQSSPHVLVDDKLEMSSLTDEQVSAVSKAAKQSLTIITGGPGSGKTYTAKKIVELFKNSGCEVVLAAPTGKAASNLKKGIPGLPAYTLHSLLGISSAKRSGSILTLSADVIIVDECSMIDIHLMAKLFAAVKDGARLVMIGDMDQLPPVDAGVLFADITRHYYNTDLVATLSLCLRTDSEDLVALAGAINTKNVEKVLRTIGNDNSITVHPLSENVAVAHRDIVDYASKAFPCAEDINTRTIPEIFSLFDKFRILSPLRKGLLGVDILNKLLRERFTTLPVAPIMIARNDYKLNLINGDIGLLTADGYAFFPGGDDKDQYFDVSAQARKIPAFLIAQYEYAYCISVHKSQGSEFDSVLLVLPPGSEVFGKEMLYTAITRSKRYIDMLTNETIIESTMQRSTQRLSGIAMRLSRGHDIRK